MNLIRVQIIIYLILMSSCQQDNGEVIYVDVDRNYESLLSDNKIFFQSLIKIDTIINLQTNDSSIIGRIAKVEYYKNNYYILDKTYSNSLFCFNKDGSFINKTRIGKGPGEIVKISDFNIRDNNLIEVWDGKSRKMVKYLPNLEYLSEKKYPLISLLSFKRLDNSLIFAQVFSDKRDDDRIDSYCIFEDKTGEIIQKFCPINVDFGALLGANIISSYKHNILFACVADRNIYQIDNRDVKTRYIIDFGKYNLEKKEIDKGFSYVIDLFRSNKRILGIDNLFENDSFIIFGYYHLRAKGHLFSCIFSKVTKKIYCISHYPEQVLPILEIKGVLPDNKFIGIVQPFNLKQYYKLLNISNNIKDTDNPSLVIFSLNEK